MVEGLYPSSIYEALQFREQYADSILVAGGSDVGVVKRYGEHMIFINQIAELQKVWMEHTSLMIGAGMTYVSLIEHPQVPEVLKAAMRKVASPAIRNVGTVAGNICNASPAGDTLPVLYALEAKIVIAFLKNKEIHTRKIEIQDFILGIRKIALQANEMVIAIEIPEIKRIQNMSFYYEKVGARQAEAISKASFAALWEISCDILTDLRICFGSVGITVLRCEEFEKCLFGLSPEQIQKKKTEIVKKYEKVLAPIDDQRTTAAYRKKVCLHLLEDCLTQIV